jgi:hypothetical protein
MESVFSSRFDSGNERIAIVMYVKIGLEIGHTHAYKFNIKFVSDWSGDRPYTCLQIQY